MNNLCICWFFMHPLNAELNPICHLLALLGVATIVVVSRLRVKGRVELSFYSPSGPSWPLLRVNCILHRRAVHCCRRVLTLQLNLLNFLEDTFPPETSEGRSVFQHVLVT